MIVRSENGDPEAGYGNMRIEGSSKNKGTHKIQIDNQNVGIRAIPTDTSCQILEISCSIIKMDFPLTQDSSHNESYNQCPMPVDD